MTPGEMTADQAAQPAGGAPRKSDTPQLFVLAGRADLDKKINVAGETPRVVETIKDDEGNILIRKYEALSKAIWQKYRTKPECKPLHFICEIPLSIIDDINATFLLPDDFQFLGALYSGWGKDAIAEQFFNEAIKTGTADAHINAGVFRFLRGEQGVMDNFTLAKRHFYKAINLLPAATLTADEKNKRQKICDAAIDQIDYRFSSVFSKVIRMIIRILTFQFGTAINFVGAASAKELTNLKIQVLTEGILKQEFELKKAAFHKFIHDLRSRIPPDYRHVDEELMEIETEYGKLDRPEILEIAVARMAEFHTQYSNILESREQKAVAAEPPDESLIPPNVLCYELAGADEIDRLAIRYKLTSVSELIDMAARLTDDPPLIAWLIRDKTEQPAVMEKLLLNKTVPDNVKKILRRHLRI